MGANDMYEPDDFAIGHLFWGTLIFLAISVACFFAIRALRALLDRRTAGSEAEHDGAPEIAGDSWADKAISRPPGDRNHAARFGADLGGMESMSEREQELLFSTYAPRKVRKAMKQRRKMREQGSR
jgi:hypothetical protein